ncbi:hypothetical protein EMCG_06813 [[Emmonsia] crescens]|uniref:Uncharacterized protein n=1 Tax=[Emmonsia] crescens TaxID=73230 RepID=A0A0G2J6C7_9EURO|nr:hypothetical protein EMCG_06813 [Emmonsia crescens UAMH 3008]
MWHCHPPSDFLMDRLCRIFQEEECQNLTLTHRVPAALSRQHLAAALERANRIAHEVTYKPGSSSWASFKGLAVDTGSPRAWRHSPSHARASFNSNDTCSSADETVLSFSLDVFLYKANALYVVHVISYQMLNGSIFLFHMAELRDQTRSSFIETDEVDCTGVIDSQGAVQPRGK